MRDRGIVRETDRGKDNERDIRLVRERERW